MPEELESFDDFIDALAEVDALLKLADDCIKDKQKHTALNKAAFLLLMGKFEAFAEGICEDYICAINDRKPSISSIPESVRFHHCMAALKQLDSLKHKAKRIQAIDVLSEVGGLWASDGKFVDLKVNCKFSYGKHGEAELERLFERIGFDDIFTLVPVYDEAESISESSVSVAVDFRGTFNSVTHMRNNILHQDASPDLTPDLIHRYKRLFQSFAQTLVKMLRKSLAGVSSSTKQ